MRYREACGKVPHPMILADFRFPLQSMNCVIYSIKYVTVTENYRHNFIP